MEGVTSSERYLAGLCRRSFLSLWSYPNAHRDQSGGKELCDLLVVFNDTAIIFSDKSCRYPNTGDPDVDWRRWSERAIRKSIAQAYGAERWLRRYPERIFVDAKCERRLPIDLRQVTSFHRVVVANGAAERCEAEGGSRGSLMLVGMAELSAHRRFVVGPEDPFVHILDEVTLDLVLRELDTITDFINYLRAKEELIASSRFLFAYGEEDLLGYFLMSNGSQRGIHAFPTTDRMLALDEGFWDYATTHPHFLKKKRDDRVSYWWDRMIEIFATHVREGTLAPGSEPDFTDHEARLRIMAAESRFHRRYLAAAFLQYAATAPAEQLNVRVLQSPGDPALLYILLLVPNENRGSYEEYRTW